MSNILAAKFNPQRPFDVPQYATCSGMSETDEKALESMANNVKASYAWHFEKARTDLKKQLEEKNREIDNLHNPDDYSEVSFYLAAAHPARRDKKGSGMSETDEKALESRAKNLKGSYAWHVKKACEGQCKQLEEKNREIDNLHKSREVEKESSRAMDDYGQGTPQSMDYRRHPSHQQAPGGPELKKNKYIS